MHHFRFVVRWSVAILRPFALLLFLLLLFDHPNLDTGAKFVLVFIEFLRGMNKD